MRKPKQCSHDADLKGYSESAVVNAATVHIMYRKIRQAVDIIEHASGGPSIDKALGIIKECTDYMAEWLGLGKPGMQER